MSTESEVRWLNETLRETNALLIELLDEIRVTPTGPAEQLPLVDGLHTTGRCTCAGEGRCWWCLWTKEREERYNAAHLAATMYDAAIAAGSDIDNEVGAGGLTYRERIKALQGEAIGVVHAAGCDGDPCSCGKVGQT